MRNKRLFIILLVAVIVLLIPFIAMQFTDEVYWTPLDFAVAGALLISAGLMVDLAIRKISKIEYRIAACAGLVAALLLLWAELAVGIF